MVVNKTMAGRKRVGCCCSLFVVEDEGAMKGEVRSEKDEKQSRVALVTDD